MASSTTWPRNRDRPDLLAHLHDTQAISLTCGIDGCKRKFNGEFARVIARRNTHRATEHPDFVEPKRKGKGGFLRRETKT